MTSKEKIKSEIATVVAVSLTVIGATCGVASAVNGNDAGLIASSVVMIAGEAVRQK